MSRLNLHIYPSSFRYETRILKETKSIADASLVDQVHILAIWEDGLAEHEHLDGKRLVWRVRLRIGNQRPNFIIKLVRYFEWQIRIFFRFCISPVKSVNCHSLSVLPLGIFFKILKRSVIIYDTHELETETVGSAGMRRLLAKSAERILVRFADAVITVNESIAGWYRNEYELKNVYVVRNIPYRWDLEDNYSSVLKSRLGINPEEMLFIYQGVFGDGRGLGILLDVFANVDRQKHIVFMGYGEWRRTIKQHELANSNIHLLDAVKLDELLRYTASADVGICLFENVCLNYLLVLPNKVFEYIMSGLPLIVSDFPEMRRVVEDAKCGWTIPPDRDALFSLVTAISWADVAEKRKNALQYRKTIGWHKEEVVLLKLYRELAEQWT